MRDAYYLNWQGRLQSSRGFRLFWTFWGLYAILAVFAVGLYLLVLRRWDVLIAAFMAFVLGRLVISPLIYLVYKRERPYQALQFHPATSILFSGITTRLNAFPSDHAVSMSAIGGVLFWFLPGVGIAVLVIGLLNSWGRIVLGYHYPNNIFAGWLIGLFSAFAAVHWLLPVVAKYI